MIGEGTQESLAEDDSQLHADHLLAQAVNISPALEGAKAIPAPVGYCPMPLDWYPVLGFGVTFFLSLLLGLSPSP